MELKTLKKFTEFLNIAKKLNSIGIVPLLLGSSGLEYLTGKDFKSEDIDIHVPGDPRGWEAPDDKRIYNWHLIERTMNELGYQLQDVHEHSFNNGIYNVEFGTLNSLPDFADIALNELVKQHDQGISFLTPTLEQYLKIYQSSASDPYRNKIDSNRDKSKIDYLKSIID